MNQQTIRIDNTNAFNVFDACDRAKEEGVESVRIALDDGVRSETMDPGLLGIAWDQAENARDLMSCETFEVIIELE